MLLEIVIIIVFGAFCRYFLLKRRCEFWERRRVPYLTPDSLLCGNFRDVFFWNSSLLDHVRKLYEDLAPHQYGGVFFTWKPVLFVRDPKVIHRILNTDFRHFTDRSSGQADERNPLSQQLPSLTGSEWSRLRHELAPTFTSGNMRLLFGLVKKCTEKMEEIVAMCTIDDETVNVKDLMTRYTTDVVSLCVFDLEADSLNDTNSELRLYGSAALVPTRKRTVYNLLLNACPRLRWIVGHSELPQIGTHFFTNYSIEETVNHRKQSGVIEHDFVNLLMDLSEKEKGKLDLNIASQCFFLYIAGFETSSTALSFILYELAANSHVQEKLQDEIDRVLESHGGEITYEGLQEMHYMQQVFDETSRLYPALPLLQRVCTKDYSFPHSTLQMQKGETVFIPVQGLHRDLRYYPNPNDFNPDNFSDEAKASRPPCTFLPFGDGPRNCIGHQFSLMQIKLALATLLRQYTISISPRMILPLTVKPGAFVTTSSDEILLDFYPRYE